MRNIFERLDSLLYTEPKRYHGIPVSDALASTLNMACLELADLHQTYGFFENPNPFALNEESQGFLNLFIEREMTDQMQYKSLGGWYDDRLTTEINAHYIARYQDLLKKSSIAKLPDAQQNILHTPLFSVAQQLVEAYFSEDIDESSFTRNAILKACHNDIDEYRLIERAFAIPHSSDTPKRELLTPRLFSVVDSTKAFAKRNKNILAATGVFIGIFGGAHIAHNGIISNEPAHTPSAVNTPASYTLSHRDIIAIRDELRAIQEKQIHTPTADNNASPKIAKLTK